jgi:hypothetical protein
MEGLMTRMGLTFAVLAVMWPLAGALAQGSLTPVIPSDDKAQLDAVRAGHASGHRPFFYWLTGDGASQAKASAPAAEPPPPPVLKTGMSTGTK